MASEDAILIERGDLWCQLHGLDTEQFRELREYLHDRSERSKYLVRQTEDYVEPVERFITEKAKFKSGLLSYVTEYIEEQWGVPCYEKDQRTIQESPEQELVDDTIDRKSVV